MAEDGKVKSNAVEDRLPDYVKFDQQAVGDCNDVDLALAAHLKWVLANTDRWYLSGKWSPGMISDAMLKNVDQRLDLEKLSKTGGLIDPETLMKIMRGEPLETGQDESG